ncbi:hypothetical protein [Aeromonas hydrophila]|uniref:hypothetical protein n=1 Tax=Aeromonas hydrophila TaxID=644 RepID=UPI000A940413|nr:hypothetical protein [Aeromonas hydrophila]EGX6957492.1 hypothetical protein [Aeromonas hydrophila]MCA4697953.1 hypothetical protein [Aeromonas hydrophila]MCO4221058.1 hypothetical protein [Aeromonas hydrophila]QIO18411.1 hypothetical protein G9455_11400 [Aeromonas hydrophila]USJ78828.1 hypothetical protein LDP97_07230 [Aeromonas hydrophila]
MSNSISKLGYVINIHTKQIQTWADWMLDAIDNPNTFIKTSDFVPFDYDQCAEIIGGAK